MNQVDQSSDLNLLYDWDHSLYPPQPRRAAGLSLLAHILGFAILLMLPDSRSVRPAIPELRVAKEKATPLLAPRRFEMTQKEANRGKVAKEVTLEALLPKQQQKQRITPPPRQFVLPQARPMEQPQLLADAPKIDPGAGPRIDLPQFTTQLPPVEKPKLAFENPGAGTGTGTGIGRVPTPKTGVDEAVRAVVRNRGTMGGMVVTDMMDLPAGAGATLSATPNQGRAGSSLELLSDPAGVDFKPYLIRVLAAVRRNWFAVIPESARLGLRGKVAIQFSISREGRVPKLVISSPSGTEALDRAAVAGISASNPFPPLPAEFKGDQIRLQLSFAYNIPVN